MLLERSGMDKPDLQQKRPEERTVTPAEVWEKLSPDVQARVVSLLGKMAYKYVLARCGSLLKGVEEKDEIQGHESQDHT
jgi:hypothetical protein